MIGSQITRHLPQPYHSLAKKICFYKILLTFLFSLSSTSNVAGDIVVDFEDLTLAEHSAAAANENDFTPFVSRSVTFNRTWNTHYNCCPGGFAYSNLTDLNSAGFTNANSAFVLPNGGGANGSSQFVVGFDSSPDEAIVTLPQPSSITGVYVANTTYTYLAMVDGNDGAGFVKGPFTDGDWFKMTFLGKDDLGNLTGNVDFYLADYRDGNSFAVADWTWVNLTGLGKSVKTIEFELSSTDNSEFGMATPAYFALDNLTMSSRVPFDFDNSSDYNAADIEILYRQIPGTVPPADPIFDLVPDGVINQNDIDHFIKTIIGTRLGDTNVDHDVDTADLTTAIMNFTGVGGKDKLWRHGNTDGDQDVDTADLTTAIINFTGAANRLPQTTPQLFSSAELLPEPTSVILLVFGIMGYIAIMLRNVAITHQGMS